MASRRTSIIVTLFSSSTVPQFDKLPDAVTAKQLNRRKEPIVWVDPSTVKVPVHR